jgi:hypothetical protein
MEAEKVTSKLCNYLSDAIVDMLEAVQTERYEHAAYIRDEIEDRIRKVSIYIIKNNMSTLEEQYIYEELQNLKWLYIKLWEDVLGVEGGSGLKNK